MTDEQIIALVNERIEKTEIQLLERIEKTETTLLKEFRKWATRIEARGRVAETSILGFNERLTVLEERVDDLENAS
jgi:hypothetical protein